jgi:phospholipid transport system transporter-binding protein
MNIAVEFSARDSQGVVRVKGPLTFQTALSALKPGLSLLEKGERLRFDLSGIERADGAGVALLVEWLRHAKVQHVDLGYTNIPDFLLAILRVSGVQDMKAFASP